MIKMRILYNIFYIIKLSKISNYMYKPVVNNWLLVLRKIIKYKCHWHVYNYVNSINKVDVFVSFEKCQ